MAKQIQIFGIVLLVAVLALPLDVLACSDQQVMLDAMRGFPTAPQARPSEV